jgi:hypothetical protein
VSHRQVADALAGGVISESWAREICRWTDLLPQEVRDDADVILLGAAAAGAELADLTGLAEELRNRTAAPDTGDDDGFTDRSLRLESTFQGAGRLDGDLTPGCAAALRAVLDALGKKAGPEDTRAQRQRDHGALEEAMRRLIASGCLPQRAGQPTQIQLHMTLRDLMKLSEPQGQPGAVNAGTPRPGPAVPPGYDCDAQIVPIVTGHIDPDVADQFAAALLRTGQPAAGAGAGTSQDAARIPGDASASAGADTARGRPR